MRGNSNIAVLVFIGVPVCINIRYGVLVVVCDAMRVLCNVFFLGVMCVAGIGCCVLWCELCLIRLLKFAVSILNIHL